MKFDSILALATLMGLAAAPADEKTIGDGTLPTFLQQFDTNEDGSIDEEERQAIRAFRQKLREERRASIDTDGNGSISRDEIKAARQAIRAKIEERRKERFAEIAGDDEVIDRKEFLTIPGIGRLPEFIQEALFSRLDADGNEAISSEEFLFRLRRHDDRGSNPGASFPLLPPTLENFPPFINPPTLKSPEEG